MSTTPEEPVTPDETPDEENRPVSEPDVEGDPDIVAPDPVADA